MSSQKYRLAFIVPRYLTQSAGGAEVHCQEMAEKVASLGHQVDVLTTCAKNHFSWENHFPPGEINHNGVKIIRFEVNVDRKVSSFISIQNRISARQCVTRDEEIKWIRSSVNSNTMEGYIKRNHFQYDFLIYIPYLFGTTYQGAKLFPEKTLLIPCLHDEPFAYLKIFKEMFLSVRGHLFNTHAEMKLAKRLYGLDPEKCVFVSAGFEKKSNVGEEVFRNRFGIKDPYILFAGRRERGKNVPLLIEYFRIYKQHNQNNLKLVLIGSGPVDLIPEDEGNIYDFGFVSEDEKLSATAGAFAFCQPSSNESLSIVVLQSWLYEVPALVHGRCEVTREHCEESNGGLHFSNYFEFEECLNTMLKNPEATKQMGHNGCSYVDKNFKWEVVLKRFEGALDKFSQQEATASK